MNSRIFTVFIIVFAFMVTIAATDILLPSLPSITRFFFSDPNTTQLAIPLHLLGSMLTAPLWGIIADRKDRKNVMAWGLVVFILGNILCLLAWNMEIFLFGRFVQGVGAIAIPVTGYVMIHDLYPDDQSAKVISWAGSAIVVAPIVAPLIGGYLEVLYGWQANFYSLLMFAMAPLLFLVFLRTKKPEGEQKVLATASPRQIVKAYHKILTHRNFLLYVCMFGFLSCGEWCFFTMAPFYFQNTLNVTPEAFGLYLFMSASFYLAGSLFSANTLKWFRVDQVLWMGVGVSLAASILMFVLFLLAPLSPLLITLVFGVFLFGNAAVWGPSTSRALQSVHKYKGTASAVRSLVLTAFYSLGGFLGSLLDDASLLPISLVLLGTSVMTVIVLNYICHKTE